MSPESPANRPLLVVPAALIEEISAGVDAIGADPTAAGPRWGSLHKLLLKAKVAPTDVARLIMSRDLEGARTLLRSLRGEAPPTDAEPGPEGSTAPPSSAAPDPDPAMLKAALRAFRKRLKLIRLDHESRLGVGPLTGGKSHEVDAIMPPNDFPTAAWKALAASGKLRDVGRGFYALAEEVD